MNNVIGEKHKLDFKVGIGILGTI